MTGVLRLLLRQLLTSLSYRRQFLLYAPGYSACWLPPLFGDDGISLQGLTAFETIQSLSSGSSRSS